MPRREAASELRDRISGRGRFVADLAHDTAAWMVVVAELRGRARARLISVDVTAAREAEGVLLARRGGIGLRGQIFPACSVRMMATERMNYAACSRCWPMQSGALRGRTARHRGGDKPSRGRGCSRAGAARSRPGGAPEVAVTTRPQVRLRWPCGADGEDNEFCGFASAVAAVHGVRAE